MPNLSFSWVSMCASSALLEQRLGRDAADVEADAAPVLLLDHRHGLAELGGADRGDVATGAGTEDEDIEVRVGHGPSLRTGDAAREPRSAHEEERNILA